MRIRKATVEDARTISRIHSDTIRYVNSRDYTPKQIREWIPINRTARIRKLLKEGKLYFLLIDKDVVGVSSLMLEESELGSLYIKHTAHGKGYGSRLLRYVEGYAKRHGVNRLRLHSTTTAYSFYKNKGYTRIRKSSHRMGCADISCILMTKRL
jgi:putative acetyltransferase